MLSVIIADIVLSVARLNVVILNVVALKNSLSFNECLPRFILKVDAGMIGFFT
jgi:hypothetical protein